MIRCPQCRQPNSEEIKGCAACGAKLVPARGLAPNWSQELQGRPWLKLTFAAAGMLVFRIAVQPLISRRTGLDANHLGFQLFQGGGLALALAWCRGLQLKSLLIWGLVGGLLSFALDLVFTWQWQGYKVIWNISYFLYGGDQGKATHLTYALLQAVRFVGPAIMLWIAQTRELRRVRAAEIGLAGVFLATLFYSQLRGVNLTLAKLSSGAVSVYFLSIFTLLTALFSNTALEIKYQKKQTKLDL